MKDKIQNKKLKESSRKWLQRQFSDPFVVKAKAAGYRSRAAFKIIEIQNKFKLVNRNSIVIDLGAAPGGWSQVISKTCKKVIAIDLLDMDPLPGVSFLKGDFLDRENIAKIKEMLLENKADVIISDMAPNTCGIKKIDHLRIMGLLEAIFEFCQTSLKEGGAMIAKVFQGGAEQNFLKVINQHFKKVVHFKPNSSRKESPEIYLVAMGFKEPIS